MEEFSSPDTYVPAA